MAKESKTEDKEPQAKAIEPNEPIKETGPVENADTGATNTEEPPVKSKKDMLRDMYSSIIDDFDPEDEEGSSEKVLSYLIKSKEQKAKLAEALKSDPRLASVLADIVSGKKNAAGALTRYFGKDFLNAEEGTEEYDAIVEAEKERKAEQDKAEASKKEYEANLEKSMPEVEAYCKEKGYNVEDFLNNAWDKILQPIMSGIYTKEVLDVLDKGFNYDKDVKDALVAGEIKGKNENIHKMKAKAGDGMPKMGGSETVVDKPKKGNSFINQALQA